MHATTLRQAQAESSPPSSIGCRPCTLPVVTLRMHCHWPSFLAERTTMSETNGKTGDAYRHCALDLRGKAFDQAAEHVIRRGSEFVSNLSKSAPYRDSSKDVVPTLTKQGVGVSEAIDELYDALSQDGVNAASGHHVGYVPGGGVPAGAFGDFIAALTNKFSGYYFASPNAVKMGNQVIRWALDLVGYPNDAWGAILSGGTLATMNCLLAAREWRGMVEALSHGRVYLSEQAHIIVRRCLKILGIRQIQIQIVPCDDDLKMRMDTLQTMLDEDIAQGWKPWIIVSSGGTTNTGAIDPLDEVSHICAKYNIWHHVDAAYGGFFLLTDVGRVRLDAVKHSHSIVLDPHKGLFMPYGCGIGLVRNARLLEQAIEPLDQADYLQGLDSEEERSPADFSPELTRHFRSARIWLSLRAHGEIEFRNQLEEKLGLAELLYKELQRIEGIQTSWKPELTVVPFRVKSVSNEPTRELQRSLTRTFVSSTTIGGTLYLRPCILVFRTHKEEIFVLLEEIRQHMMNTCT
eukprot:gb/GECG01004994.1/.p1 GENE.gb/GECG01004994.1/~~gb/GECG01004994.1/.p1  ORF type:complete len:518 (+),score=42.41 gb/GECG01004994.1/:1-1554(+)